MITFTDFFVVNRDIILFIYGLVFFILGFAIILQTRQSSRLELARSLRWLAVFGITHSFYEWGDLFIPLQGDYLQENVMQALYFFHKILLALSFLCLFEFGIAVLPGNRRTHWIHWETIIVLLVWILTAFILFPGNPLDLEWRRNANAFARYIIGFPGGVIAAYGLRAHTLQRIAPLNVPKIVRMFQVAGISLGLYAFLGGLIPPPVNFFPGNIVNTQTFTSYFGAPPMVFRSLVGTIIAFTIIRALEIFDLETERRIEHLEQQQIVNSEHERLARNLHDGAIQKVYTAGLLVESAVKIAEPESEVDRRLRRAMAALSDSIVDLRRNLSDLHAHTQVNQESIPALLQKIADDPNYNSMVHITVSSKLSVEKYISDRRTGHLIAIVNEIMANAVRHAQAHNLHIDAADLGEMLYVGIKDDGIGLPPEVQNGYGLRNIRDRTRLLNGKINFKNNKGLMITLEIPWNE